ncbi:MAG: 2-amino-4-hydroxy-6-hydroxymethyldihydropteridine diphosphokinase [Bacteroidales bacterium]|nr:2-amino-4-hydroxy-6-hydroxymethyldihydropteridine diphosphokinase [Bacteroidales bacterium]
MAVVYLALGTNIGDCESNLNQAVQLIEERIGNITSLSAFYASEPWGFESQNTFLNAALKLETFYSPFQLLNKTQQIEIEMGRTKKSRGAYSDRVIDIDIIYYDLEKICVEQLIVPHPLMQLREFVLSPLVEIAPDLLHPILQKTSKQLLYELQSGLNS